MRKIAAGASAFALLATTGCANVAHQALGTDLDRAPELGLILTPPQPDLFQPVPLARYARLDRDDYTLLWMKRSDELCGAYKSEIIRVSRDSRLASGLLATVLGGLATIFTPVATVRALAGAASIATGTGAVFQSDTFNGQVGEILTAAIETARRNQANQIKQNLEQFGSEKYSLYSSLRDVVDYHDMCSLNTALIQVRASLQATSPDGGLTSPARQGQQSPGGISPEAKTEVERKQAVIRNPDTVLQRPPQPPRASGDASFGTVLPPLGSQQVQLLQRALCVADTGDLGPAGSPTQVAITQYFARRSVPLTVSNVNELFKAVDKVGNCRAKGYRNAFEVREYGVAEASVSDLQAALNTKLQNVSPPIGITGAFDPPTRTAIQNVREEGKQHPELGGQMDSGLNAYLVRNPAPFAKPSP